MVGRHGGRSRADAQPDLQVPCHLGPDRGHPDEEVDGVPTGVASGNMMMLRELAVAGNIGDRKELNRSQSPPGIGAKGLAGLTACDLPIVPTGAKP